MQQREQKNAIQQLIENLENARSGIVGVASRPGEKTVSVPLITSSASSLYERMRSLLDNKEQHVIRWHAIYRTLGRLMRSYLDDKVIASELLQELVADGFLPNETVPISVSSKIQYALLKYRVLEGRFHTPDLFKIVASEVESMLYGNRKEFFVKAFYDMVREAVAYDSPLEKNQELYADTCLYLACRKAFLEDDEAGLLYGVWLKFFPEWETLTDIDGTDMDRVPAVLQLACRSIADPTYRRIARQLRDQSVYFLVLKGLLETQRDVSVGRRDATQEQTIRLEVSRLFGLQHHTAYEMGVRAFWYILITKTAIILPVEYMLTKVFFPPIEMLPLAVNLVFHPLLLLIMTRTIHEPKKVNADMIVSGVSRLLSSEVLDPIRIKTVRGVSAPYLILYFFMVVGVFSLSVWALERIGFTPMNTLFFIVLLGIISFFGFRVRTKAKKFTLRRYTEMYPPNFWVSIFTIPFIDVGRRLSDGFRAINIFTELMDLFIEVPFKTLMRLLGVIVPFLEKTLWRAIHAFIISPILFLRKIKRSFSNFIKERKEEID